MVHVLSTGNLIPHTRPPSLSKRSLSTRPSKYLRNPPPCIPRRQLRHPPRIILNTNRKLLSPPRTLRARRPSLSIWVKGMGNGARWRSGDV
jgi:hypothetical protein